MQGEKGIPPECGKDVVVALSGMGHIETAEDERGRREGRLAREVLQRDDGGCVLAENDLAFNFLTAQLLVEDGVRHHGALLVRHIDVLGHLGTEDTHSILLGLDDHQLPRRSHIRGSDRTDSRVDRIALRIHAA